MQTIAKVKRLLKMLKLLCCTREASGVGEDEGNSHSEDEIKMSDVNTQDDDGWTKLHRAARNGQYEEVRWLVERGADVNIKTKYGGGATAVMMAAWGGHREIVEYLHQVGADINIRAKYTGASALDKAAVRKRYPVCQYLVQAGADCSNAPGDLLCWAADQGDLAMVQQMVTAGADVNKNNRQGDLPLSIAADRGHLELCQWMVEAGADVTKSLDPLLYCAALHGDLDLCQHWVQAGADINKRNSDEDTPVNVAAKQGHHHLCEYFMNNGADLNIADKNGLAPLYFISQAGYNDLVKKMIDHGADVNSVGCLQVALDNYNNDVAETLIERGCDVNKVRFI